MTNIACLPDRCVLEVSGADRVNYLQGLVSNDMTEVRPGHAVWTGLLTPQGRYLADFFVLADGDRLLLDVARGQSALVQQKLRRFKLRNQVAIAETELAVYVAWKAAPAVVDALSVSDPRLDGIWRLLGVSVITNAGESDWDHYRLSRGLPETVDMEPERTLLLEAGFDELHGVSWSKGCYMGQELTARTKYRGLVKKRLLPVRVSGPMPASGAPILQDGAEVGTMRSGRDGQGMALLRLDALGAEMRCDAAVLEAWRPDWMALPDAA